MTPIKYDASGRVMVNSTDPVVSWANGLPFTADGSLAVVPEASPDSFSNGGIPIAGERMAVTNG